MKLFPIFIIISLIVFSSCSKKDDSFQSSTNQSGLLSSIRVYTSFKDSGITSQNIIYGDLIFSYDALKRVDKMKINSQYYFFYYNGSSMDPYMMIDSSISTVYSTTARIITHQFTYNSSNKKIKDSIYKDYQINFPDGRITVYTPTVKAYYFNQQSTYITRRKYINNFYTDYDTTFLTSDGNVSNYSFATSSVATGREISTVTGYYADNNPFYKLNIREAIFNLNIFLPTFFFPLNFDLEYSKNIFKTLIGNNPAGYRSNPKEITTINCTYDKNSNNEINTMVISILSTDNYGLYSKFYGNLKFNYNP